MAGPTYQGLIDDILSYTENDGEDFQAEFPVFVKNAEERIWYVVQLPNFKKGSLGQLATDSQYLGLPEDFLAPASLAIIKPNGEYKYLINKDVEFIRECYPNPLSVGEPYVYALFDASADITNIIVGPSSDLTYQVQLNYFYRPTSLVDEPDGTWLSRNAYTTLLYGALSEAGNWMKKNAGIDNMADTYEQRFAEGLAALKLLGEARDRKDTYRSGEKRSQENR